MNFGGPTAEDESIRMIDAALDTGINFIDTANVYNAGESERVVGKALARDGKRDQVVLATKVHGQMGDGPNDRGNSRYHIIKACDDSLRRLQTDIPQDETLRALDDLVRAGKVRYIGCSTFPAWMVMESLMISERYNLARYITEQPPYNLLDRRIENELVPLCERYGLGLLPWSPLAGGVLAGRYAENLAPEGSRAARMGPNTFFTERVTPRAVTAAKQVAELAATRGITTSQLALLWVKDQPGVTAPIIGPRTMGHLQDNLAVLEMTLTDEDRRALDEINGPGNAISDFHNSNPWMKARVVG
jgi:aryl-alcohol dehydrogenase-like predicted oxidoreductase